ncbi:hypothetical protein L5515_019683 [Caenorhabditis briggsae]|uniref:Uncharacterized protein n=1 Tax=Caenorhabditis briggsae TaxID=6238 RepID=A0AAE9JTG3_CAEBR|nr:hypothetical protein L5515_019683 [Caenorhabditis briggsae]
MEKKPEITEKRYRPLMALPPKLTPERGLLITPDLRDRIERVQKDIMENSSFAYNKKKSAGSQEPTLSSTNDSAVPEKATAGAKRHSTSEYHERKRCKNVDEEAIMAGIDPNLSMIPLLYADKPQEKKQAESSAASATASPNTPAQEVVAKNGDEAEQADSDTEAD